MEDEEKFTSFKTYLRGNVFKAGLVIARDNCRVGLGLLERRFENRQVIINSHMEFLYKLPVFKSSEDVKNIRIFYDKMEKNLIRTHPFMRFTKYEELFYPLLYTIPKKEKKRSILTKSKKIIKHVTNFKNPLPFVRTS